MSDPAAEDLCSEAWMLHTANGTRICVPPSMHSLSTYVLLEQERWFEPEMSLLPRLLEPGMHALDIGANHGVYALEIARCTRSGHVWAFEPTAAPRAKLRRSVQANALQARVTVVDAGLADNAGHASFTVHDNSELNSREAAGPHRERVRLVTLDGYLAANAPEVAIGFVKLDAEGDELRVLAGGRRFFATQSPVVLFELKHGNVVNTALIAQWRALGFGIFRWSAELELLLPFDAATEETAFALNLVAVRPAQQAALSARGLLASAEDIAGTGLADISADALRLWCAQPAQQGPASSATAAASDVYLQALCAVASVHADTRLRPAQRVVLMAAARDALMRSLQQGPAQGPEAWVLVVHAMHALGQPLAAVQIGSQVLAHWPAGHVLGVPFVPPTCADLQRQRTTPAASWLRQVLAEFVATRSAYSSYFAPPAPERWASLLDHPDHAAEIERRYMLSHMVQDRAAAVERLRRLPDAAHTSNPALWQALLQATRAMARDAPVGCAAGAAGVLAALPPGAVQIVDVGASSLGDETEPYAALLKAGRAQLTGFEPDARALADLQRRHPDAGTHRFLPHVVGDGSAAIFHCTAWSLTASLLEPNRALLDRYQQLGELVRETGRKPVPTVRLDDVVARGGMDVLKIDVQGAERLVFDGAQQRLDECLVVWTEVEFVPLYRDQPLFGDIDARLRAHGLQFLCFAGIAQRPLASWPAAHPGAGTPPAGRQQQLWADAIYVPAPQRIAALDAAAAARLALVAHHMLAAHDLCHAALQRHDRLSESDFAPRYLAAIGAPGGRAAAPAAPARATV